MVAEQEAGIDAAVVEALEARGIVQTRTFEDFADIAWSEDQAATVYLLEDLVTERDWHISLSARTDFDAPHGPTALWACRMDTGEGYSFGEAPVMLTAFLLALVSLGMADAV